MDTNERIRAVMERHGWNQQQTALYLGVQQSTISNWLTEGKYKRKPGPGIDRLLDVLARVEFIAPALHASLMPEVKP